jgi:hypothetical protein
MENGFYLTFTGILFDLGGAIFDNILIGNDNQFDIAAGATGIEGAAGSGNLSASGRAIMSDNIFTGAGTFVNTILASDLKWHWQSNQGIEDSATFGAITKDSGRTTTILTGGTDLLAGTSTLTPGTERFDDNSLDNNLRHIGVDSKKTMVSGSIVGKSTGGGNLICDIVLRTTAADFTVLTGIEFNPSTGADAAYSFVFPATLPTNAELKLGLIRTSGTQDFDGASYAIRAWGVS